MLQLVGKLLDVAQDSGGQVGAQNNFNPYYLLSFQQNTGGLVRFVLEDFDKLQEEAYEKAIADARARAERLARLSKVELGPIVAVRELVVPSDRIRRLPRTKRRGNASKPAGSRRSRFESSCSCASASNRNPTRNNGALP